MRLLKGGSRGVTACSEASAVRVRLQEAAGVIAVRFMIGIR